jgi:multiple sugar transport system permease protein
MQIIRKRNEHPVLYVLPVLLFLIALAAYPVSSNFILSFTADGSFPSFKNYESLFSNKEFYKNIKNTFVWLGGIVTIQFAFGMTMALLLNMNIVFKKFFRTIFIIPWLAPGIVACTIWKWMYHSDFGIINHLLLKLGLIEDKVLWLSNIKIVLGSIIAVFIWKMTPFVMLMLLSGLQSIPESLYESSLIDGANWFVNFFKVTLPLMFPVIRSVILITSIWALNSFVYIFSMTRGGPAGVSETLPLFIYKTGIEQYQFEYSAAAANVLFMIIFVFAVTYIAITERKEEEVY